MSRFTDRVERDLGQIADQATPSSTAWEAIRHRMAEQDTTDPTTEVIVLVPDPYTPRARTWLLAAAALVAVALIGGLIVNSRDTDDAVVTDQPAPTVTEVEESAASTARPESQLAPMAIVGADPATGLVVRAEPNGDAEPLMTISAFETAIGFSFVDESVVTDGVSWGRIGRVGSVVIDGWITDVGYVTPLEAEGDEVQPLELLEVVSQTRAALADPDPAAALARITDEVLLSTDVSFSDDDETVSRSDLTGGAATELVAELVASPSVQQTERLSVNRRIRAASGDTIEDIVARFPGASVVDLHYGGDADDRPGTWASTLLVLEPVDGAGQTGTWQLVAIAQDGPTG